MQADFSIELGADNETLEMLWAAEGGSPRYYDLKSHPELLHDLEQSGRVPELGEFLSKVNSPKSPLETAKCDAWSSTDLNPEKEIFGTANKFGSYVDLLFSDQQTRLSLLEHERLAKGITRRLKQSPEIAAAAEFLIRRCYYLSKEEIRDGFYITFYLFGYGDDETRSREQWAAGLKLVENAIHLLFVG